MANTNYYHSQTSVVNQQLFSVFSAVYLTFLLCMSGISVASTVWVLYVHHKEFTPRWARHFQEVHETKFHRVCRPNEKPCNNNSEGTNLKRPQNVTNGTCPSPSPSVNQRLLEMKETEATLDILDDAEDARDCAKRLCDIICDRAGQRFGTVRQHPSGRMDKILFWFVGVLTAIATLTMLVLLTTE